MANPLAFSWCHPKQTPLRGVLAAVSLLVAGGCSPPPRTVEVVGRVTYNGLPIEGAIVVFYAAKNGDDLPAAGVSDARGHYELRSFFSANDMPLGAVPNDYAVAIYKYKGPDIVRAQKKMRQLAEAGEDVGRYIAKQAVFDIWPDGAPEGWPDGFVPQVNLPPKQFLRDDVLREKLSQMVRGTPLLPTRYAEPSTSGLRATVPWSDGPLILDFDLADGAIATPPR